MLPDLYRGSKAIEELDIRVHNGDISIDVDVLAITPFTPGMKFEEHAHSNFEFHYIVSGKGRVTLENEQYSLGAGDFYLTGPGLVHRQVADVRDPMVEYALRCSIRPVNDTFLDSGAVCNEHHYLLSALLNNNKQVVGDQYKVKDVYEEIFAEASLKVPGYYMVIQHKVIELIVRSARNLMDNKDHFYPVPKKDINQHRMQILKNFIQDNLSRNITVEEVARQLYVSPRQANRIVKQQTGYSVHSFIQKFKIDIAIELIEKQDLKLKEIADMTGFSSEFHLSNTVKRWTGKSPSQFRKEI